MLSRSMVKEAKDLTGNWGWFLAAGIAWLLFAFFVLSFNYTTVWAVAIFFGIGFILGGIMEFVIASVAPGWKWLHILIGIVSVLAGIIALVWPGQTFLVLAAIIGWLLLIYGVIDIISAIMTKDDDDLWWLSLIVGILQVLIGFWAISPDEATVSTYRGVVLLVVWVGATALIRGITDIIAAFRMRSIHKDLEELEDKAEARAGETVEARAGETAEAMAGAVAPSTAPPPPSPAIGATPPPPPPPPSV